MAMASIGKFSAKVREKVPEKKMNKAMRLIFVFCLGFYVGLIVEKTPGKIEAFQAQMEEQQELKEATQ